MKRRHATPPGGRRRRERRTLIGLAAVLVLVAPMCGSEGPEGPEDSGAPARVDGPGELVATVPLVAAGFALANAEGALWVAGDPRTVSEVDPGDDVIAASIEIGESPRGIASTSDSLWVTNFGEMEAGVTTGEAIDTVSRIDLATDSVSATIDVGSQPTGVATGAGSVWVVNSGDDTVSRIDPASNEVTATVPVGDAPWDIAIGDGAVWITNEGGDSVSRIDPDRAEVTATIDVGALPGAVAATADAVWVTIDRSSSFDEEDGLVRIDPATNEVVDTLSIADPNDVVETADGLWVSNFIDGTVTRIDPRAGEVRDTVDVGPNPTALATDGRALWALIDFGEAVARVDPGTS